MNWYKKAVVSPETAKSLKIERDLPTDDTFHNAVRNTNGARITEDGLEVEIIRSQHPNQSGTQAVRSGVFYQPSGSKNKDPYSGKHGYGGTEKIKGMTLLRRPLFVKGATGGRAPQMAYDMIKGKGSYEKMRMEVVGLVLACSRDSMFGGNRNIDIYNEIYKLLEKYGGDVDLTGDINEFRIITKGNNFAYAIQENIVATTVRNAGYDSVVGWSVKMDGSPFLSEIFDVREITYPSQFNPEGEIHQTLLRNNGPVA